MADISYPLSKDIVITDSIIESVTSLISTEQEKLEEVYTSYLQILQSVKAYGIMEGETAKALELFIQGAYELKGVFLNDGCCITETGSVFLDKLEEADKYLY